MFPREYGRFPIGFDTGATDVSSVRPQLSSVLSIIAGIVGQQETLTLESLMPSAGVIFSDGIEADFVEFNSGSRVIVKVAEETAQLVVG